MRFTILAVAAAFIAGVVATPMGSVEQGEGIVAYV